MKRVNKEGPAILGEPKLPAKFSTDVLGATVSSGMVVDTASPKAFARSHVEGTVNIQPKYIAIWGGSLLDYDKPLYLISASSELPEVVRILHKIGLDNIGGFFDADEVANGGFNTESIPQVTPEVIAEKARSGEVELIDVRGKAERQEAMIVGSRHSFLGELLENANNFDSEKQYALVCRTGGRSVVAASILQRAGVKNVVNLMGGVVGWELANLPVHEENAEPIG